MSSSKIITARLDTVVYSVAINPSMDTNAIYDCLRAPLSTYIGTQHIAILKPSSDLAHLSFRNLTPKTIYNIAISASQVQGIASAGPPKRVLNNLCHHH